MRNENSFEHRNAIQPLLPNDGTKAVMGCGEFAANAGAIERLRSEPEKLSMFQQESFQDAVRVGR